MPVDVHVALHVHSRTPPSTRSKRLAPLDTSPPAKEAGQLNVDDQRVDFGGDDMQLPLLRFTFNINVPVCGIAAPHTLQ